MSVSGKWLRSLGPCVQNHQMSLVSAARWFYDRITPTKVGEGGKRPPSPEKPAKAERHNGAFIALDCVFRSYIHLSLPFANTSWEEETSRKELGRRKEKPTKKWAETQGDTCKSGRKGKLVAVTTT